MQAGLDKEEWRTSGGTDDTGGCASEDVHAEGLDLRITVDGGCEVGADGLVETETAAVQEDLVNILSSFI